MLKIYLLLNFICIFFASYVSTKDYCIIGAGPSGLQMGYFLHRAERDYIIFERDPSAGWFYKIYPRHRSLISINKRFTGKSNYEFNLRHDWNSLLSDNEELLVKHYSKEFFPPADDYVRYLHDYANKLNLTIQYNTYINKVSKDTNTKIFHLTDKKQNNYTCKNLIVSTGMWVENVPANVPGIELTESYSKMSVNRDDYDGQTILILGRGNSGFETAQHLLGSANLIHMMSRGRLRLSWETHYVGDVRAVNDGPIDTYQLKSLDGQLEGDLREFEFLKKDGRIFLKFRNDKKSVITPDNVAQREGYHRVLRCTGFKFDRSIFQKDIRPKRASLKKYPEIKQNYESTVTDNMFFTGVMTHSLDWRKSAGGFIHGFRYTTRALHRHLEWKNHQVPWPSVTLPIKDLMNHLLRRINEASGIYQMFSALVDVIVFRENDTFEYFEEVGIGMLPQFYEHTGKTFLRGIVLNLEYGKNFSGPGSDPFREDRATGQAQEAHTSNFLHPVLYYFEGGIPQLEEGNKLARPIRLHHMVEDFLTEWTSPVSHILPLRWFLEYCSGLDLRKFYAESCFEYAMTGMNIPPNCQNEYMRGYGLAKPTIFPEVPGTQS